MDLRKMILQKMPKYEAITQVVIDKKRVRISYLAHWMAWQCYAEVFGKSQTHERLEQRGGFGEEELNAFYPEWRNHIIKS